MTIKGVKNQINLDKTLVDEKNNSNIKDLTNIKQKLTRISKLIKKLKNN